MSPFLLISYLDDMLIRLWTSELIVELGKVFCFCWGKE
jgi:hypothetical protein